MRAWESGVPVPARADGATGALLQRSASTEGWELYIEARAPEGAPAIARVARGRTTVSVRAEVGTTDHVVRAIGLAVRAAIATSAEARPGAVPHPRDHTPRSHQSSDGSQRK